MRINYSDGQAPILSQNFVLLDMGDLLSIKLDFILGTAD